MRYNYIPSQRYLDYRASLEIKANKLQDNKADEYFLLMKETLESRARQFTQLLSDNYKDMVTLFKIIGVNFHTLKYKASYVNNIISYVKKTGRKISAMLEALQNRFNGRLMLRFNDSVNFIDSVEHLYNKHILKIAC